MTATITCPRCRSSIPASFKFCSNCGQALREEDVASEDSAQIFESDAKPAPTEPARQAERRQITVMFCDLVGSVELSNQLDPEDLRDVIHRYQEAATRVIERWEGYVAQYLGDGILVYFGYPVAHEGEAERAARASLDILKEIRSLRRKLREEYGIEVAVRLGLHTGLVVVGEVGSGQRRENLALGETPNLAARLQSIAPPNGIVVSEATFRQITESFECTDLGLKAIKGLPREERVYEVREERFSASPLDVHGARGPLMLNGRDPEVESFRTCWKSVENGHGRILTVTGDAGIGKSHVVQLFRQELLAVSHFRVECRCSPDWRSSALFPITDWLYRVLNFYSEQPAADRLDMIEFVAERNGIGEADSVPLLASLLGVPTGDRYPDLGYSPGLRRQRTENVLIDLMLGIRGERPLVLIIEDVHWADSATRSLLNALAIHLAEKPILLLLTSRPRPETKWPDGVHSDVLSLRRLGRQQVLSIISDVARGKVLPPQLVDQIVERTDGVPLFVQELAKMVIESALVVECDACYELVEDAQVSIPATLQDSLMSRLDRLVPVKEVAQLCSVLGRDFSFELARAATRLPESSLEAALERLTEADILIADGVPPSSRYMFRHALIQEAAYESLLRSTRLETHAHIAEYLLGTGASDEVRPEMVAHHFTRAAMRDDAARQWLRAGQQAHERWTNEEALDYFGRGLALLEGLPAEPARQRLRFDLSAGLAVASLQIKGYTHPSVLSAFERARSLAEEIDDVAASIPMLKGMWMHYTVLADHRRADDLAAKLVVLSPRARDPHHAMEAEISQASTAFWRGRVEEARKLYEAILERYAAVETQPPPAFATQHPTVNVLSYLSLALWYLGESETALKYSRQAVAVAERIRHPFSSALALTFQAVLHTFSNDRYLAREASQKAIDIAKRFGYPYWIAIATMISAWAAEDDDPDMAISVMHQALAAVRSVGARIWTGYPSALLAGILARRGRSEDALTLIDSVIHQAESSDENYFLPDLLRIRSALLERMGHEDEAAALSERALEMAREQGAAPIVQRILAQSEVEAEAMGAPSSTFHTPSSHPTPPHLT